MRVTDPSNLGLVIDAVHDRWFDIDDVQFDAARRCVRIPIEPDWLLEIANVDSLDLEDSERVGKYDLNEIVFSKQRGTLIVTTGIPLTFRMGVSGLDVALSKVDPTKKQ